MSAICAACGASLGPADTACGRCGAPIALPPATSATSATSADPAASPAVPVPLPPAPPAWPAPPVLPPPPPRFGPAFAAPPGAPGRPLPVAPAPGPGGQPTAGRRRPRPRRRLLLGGGIVAAAVVVAIVVGTLAHGPGGNAVAPTASPSLAVVSPSRSPVASTTPPPTATPVPPQVVRIGITLPLSGGWLADGGEVRDGALLAIKDAAAIPGVSIETEILDHAVAGAENDTKAVSDMHALVHDNTVLGVVGPYTDWIANRQIPIANAASLLQCSPSVTWSGLTKGSDAAHLRSGHPTANSFVRTVAPDDDQGAAMADFGVRSLGKHRVVVVDDGSAGVLKLVRPFSEEWSALGGGKIVASLELGGSFESALIAAAKAKPDVVFYAGDEQGGATVRLAMTKAGLGKLPLLATEDVGFGSPTDPASYVNLAGAAAANTYIAASYSYEVPDFSGFATRYWSVYGADPGSWSAGAHACAEVILEAIRSAAASGSLTRESVRAAATAPSATVDTILGRIGFNASGDMVPGQIAVYLIEPRTKGWTFVQQFPVLTP